MSCVVSDVQQTWFCGSHKCFLELSSMLVVQQAVFSDMYGYIAGD